MNGINESENEQNMVRCDGCGRYFRTTEIHRCKSCGQLFCPECRTKTVPHADPVVIRGLDGNLGVTDQNEQQTAATQANPHVYSGGIHFLDDDKESIGGADLGNAPFGRTSQYELAPSAQPNDGYYRIPTQEEGLQNQQPPQYAYAASPAAVPGLDEAVCDECGKVYKKTEMRKCKKCGAVLCPKCRSKYKCKKTAKKQKQPAGFRTQVELYPQANQKPYELSIANDMYGEGAASRKQPKAGRKHAKLIIIIIIGCVLIAAIVVTILMINSSDSSSLPEWLWNILPSTQT